MGKETNLCELPVGTKFWCTSGAWDGEIVWKDGRKQMWIEEVDTYHELPEGGNKPCVIEITSQEIASKDEELNLFNNKQLLKITPILSSINSNVVKLQLTFSDDTDLIIESNLNGLSWEIR